MNKNELSEDFRKKLLAEDEKQIALEEKWNEFLDDEHFGKIEDKDARKFTARLLENQVSIHEAAGETTTANMAMYDPVAISMLRRAAPYMIAPKVMGVAPLSQPTGLVFALRSRYTNKDGAEALFNEANTAFSGDGVHSDAVIAPVAGKVATVQSAASADIVVDSVDGLSAGVYVIAEGVPTGAKIKSIDAGAKKITLDVPTTSALAADTVLGYATGYGTAMETSKGEGDILPKMSFTIEKVLASVGTRHLAAGWSIETEQDLKSVHGMSALQLLSDIMSTELLAEQNREIVRTLYNSAMVGATNQATPGVYDLQNADARWLGERLKALTFQMELESNAIAVATKRGRGNVMIVSPNVAAGLAMAGVLSYSKLANENLGGDFTKSTYMGKMNGVIDVYVDPYATNNFALIGYRGPSQADCGAFYCPYIPVQMFQARDPASFQPRIGMKTRYAILSNPFNDTEGKILPRTNTYYRVFGIKGLE
nr:MAG TPA: major capsid protein [Caudoviricetes sp.]